jgi:hypothetical protein
LQQLILDGVGQSYVDGEAVVVSETQLDFHHSRLKLKVRHNDK